MEVSGLDKVLLGVVSHAIWSLLESLFQGEKSSTRRQASAFSSTFAADPRMNTILMKAAASAARSSGQYSVASEDAIRSFLVTPEVEVVVRRLFAASVSEGAAEHVKRTRAAFQTTLSQYLGHPEHELADLAEQLFTLLQLSCERAFNVAIDQGVLSAHEARSAGRYRLIQDELESIKAELSLFADSKQPAVRDILEYEAKYRELVGQRHAYITPPHFDVARRLPINALYVPPNVLRLSISRTAERKALSHNEFMSSIYRAVLIGNPGAGKSSLAAKLCYDLAVRYADRLVLGRQLTPVLVVLRDYGSEKKSRPCSLLQFIETNANTKYQVSPPPKAFEYLFLSGRAMVILDGLDELLDTHYRTQIVGDVESFCHLYPSVPMLITSREVGYDKAPLDKGVFELFRLEDFDDFQVRDYATKWFMADQELPAAEQVCRSQAFIEESAVLSDLRANPLMLALMCNLYRGQNYLPRNRPDIYEKCALMLFERWDKGRGIFVQMPFEAHLSPAVNYLAHWIYSTAGLESGVTERRLIDEIVKYLLARRFENRDEAQAAAREFVEFCHGRAWVFTDTGVEKDGERLFQFTHRTFLEYFTAAHLVRIHPSPTGLGAILTPRIGLGEWDMVAQLAFQLLEKNVEGAADSLLAALLESAMTQSEPVAWTLLLFAGRCLGFLVPQPKITRDIVNECLQRCFTWSRRSTATGSQAGLEMRLDDPANLLSILIRSADENRRTIANSIRKVVATNVAEGTNLRAQLALEIGLNLTFPLYFSGQNLSRRNDLLQFWSEQSSHVLEDSKPKILVLAETVRRIAHDALSIGAITVEQYTERFGVNSLFCECNYIVFPTMRSASVAETALSYFDWDTIALSARAEDHRRLVEVVLNQLGQTLSARLPLRVSSANPLPYPPISLDAARAKVGVTTMLGSVPPGPLFGGLLVAAIILEMAESLPGTPGSSSPHVLVQLLRARYERAKSTSITDLEQLPLAEDQLSLIRSWMRRETHFVVTEG